MNQSNQSLSNRIRFNRMLCNQTHQTGKQERALGKKEYAKLPKEFSKEFSKDVRVRGQLNSAVFYFKNALNRHGGDLESVLYMSAIKYKLGEFEEAKQYVEKAEHLATKAYYHSKAISPEFHVVAFLNLCLGVVLGDVERIFKAYGALDFQNSLLQEKLQELKLLPIKEIIGTAQYESMMKILAIYDRHGTHILWDKPGEASIRISEKARLVQYAFEIGDYKTAKRLMKEEMHKPYHFGVGYYQAKFTLLTAQISFHEGKFKACNDRLFQYLSTSDPKDLWNQEVFSKEDSFDTEMRVLKVRAILKAITLKDMQVWKPSQKELLAAERDLSIAMDMSRNEAYLSPQDKEAKRGELLALRSELHRAMEQDILYQKNLNDALEKYQQGKLKECFENLSAYMDGVHGFQNVKMNSLKALAVLKAHCTGESGAWMPKTEVFRSILENVNQMMEETQMEAGMSETDRSQKIIELLNIRKKLYKALGNDREAKQDQMLSEKYMEGKLELYIDRATEILNESFFQGQTPSSELLSALQYVNTALHMTKNDSELTEEHKMLQRANLMVLRASIQKALKNDANALLDLQQASLFNTHHGIASQRFQKVSKQFQFGVQAFEIGTKRPVIAENLMRKKHEGEQTLSIRAR